MRNLRLALCGLTAVGLAACGDQLVVENLTDADRDRALARPADVENFIGATYAQVQNATLGGSNDDLQTQMQVMGMENTSALANFAMGPRGSIPRTPIENTRNSTGGAGNFRDYLVLHRAARMATIGISRLKVLTLGSAAQDARARAFARFSQGVALGNLALTYDSASILTENDDPESPAVPLSHYTVVMQAALGYLDSAIAIATNSGSGFPLPSQWINGNPLSKANFIRLARSYKARLRASVARDTAERAAVAWDSVIADANAGITADFNITMTPAAGWDVVWPIQAFATGPANWHQLSQFWLGMADSSEGYDAWLALPNADREPFLVVTADLRFPGAPGSNCLAPCPDEARDAQNGDTLRSGYRTFTGLPYIRNRPSGEDQPGQPLQISMYDFYRSRTFASAGRIGPYPIMTRAEMRLLAAEGYLRIATPNIPAARVRIDSSRVAAGLRSLDSLGISDPLTPLPAGGRSCVPRVPIGPSYTSSACGTLWDALKWEYRMETMYTGYGMWYFAGRGWGDLPQGTAIQFPVPWQEMDTRRQVFYPMGGPGLLGGAMNVNYGLRAGGVY